MCFYDFANVFKETLINIAVRDRVHERLQGFGTPYESYTIATLQAQKREVCIFADDFNCLYFLIKTIFSTFEAEGKAKEKEATENPSQIQKVYTHHDAPTLRRVTPSNVV